MEKNNNNNKTQALQNLSNQFLHMVSKHRKSIRWKMLNWERFCSSASEGSSRSDGYTLFKKTGEKRISEEVKIKIWRWIGHVLRMDKENNCDLLPQYPS